MFSWAMDEITHWPKSYFLSSPTCDEIVLWMIEIWMKSHLVQYSLQQMTTNVGFTSG